MCQDKREVPPPVRLTLFAYIKLAVMLRRMLFPLYFDKSAAADDQLEEPCEVIVICARVAHFPEKFPEI